jgi:fatty-acid peroxygenase
LLDEQTAAVELLNIVRPTVAVAWFVSFATLALHQHPNWTERPASGRNESMDDDLEAFAREVRRLYPFALLLGARVERPFTWRGHRLPEGRLVLLDVYGTNHDPELWPDPEAFDPTRFVGVEPDPLAFVPHGGGDPATGHRCAGERVTVELLKGRRPGTRQPPLRRAHPGPALSAGPDPDPTRSGFRIANVRPA